MEDKNNKWGFLRETEVQAKTAGVDKPTGLHRTGLNTYLNAIFPNTNDWIHDKVVKGLMVNGKQSRFRPDYRSENLKLIVEFDGIQHYQNPEKILMDEEKIRIFTKEGYKIVRIPYFIQLSNKVIKRLFDVDMKEEMFDESIPSLTIDGACTPAFLCPLGIKRMAKEFHEISPEQYKVNKEYLDSQNPLLTGLDLLEKEYQSIS